MESAHEVGRPTAVHGDAGETRANHAVVGTAWVRVRRERDPDLVVSTSFSDFARQGASTPAQPEGQAGGCTICYHQRGNGL